MRKILYYLILIFLASSFFCCKKEQLKESSIEISEIPENRIKIYESYEERSDTPSSPVYSDALTGIFVVKNKDHLS